MVSMIFLKFKTVMHLDYKDKIVPGYNTSFYHPSFCTILAQAVHFWAADSVPTSEYSLSLV